MTNSTAAIHDIAARAGLEIRSLATTCRDGEAGGGGAAEG